MLPFIISSDVALPGESTRAIAPIVGVTYDTVQRDIRADRNLSPVSDDTPEPVAKITEAESQKQP